MANKNTLRNRAAGVAGYYAKTGQPIDTGGGPKRKKYPGGISMQDQADIFAGLKIKHAAKKDKTPRKRWSSDEDN